MNLELEFRKVFLTWTLQVSSQYQNLQHIVHKKKRQKSVGWLAQKMVEHGTWNLEHGTWNLELRMTEK